MLNFETRGKQPPVTLNGSGRSKVPAPVVVLSPTQQLERWISQGAAAPHAQISSLTPEMAKLLLERNPENRALKLHSQTRSIPAYIRAIESGEWQLNGTTVVVSKCGLLNDGQNRCEAVLATGTAIDTFFAFGVERDSRITLDQGAGRTGSDVLEMAGYKRNSRHLATMAQFLYAYMNKLSMNARPSTTEIVEIVRSWGQPADEHVLVTAIQETGKLSNDYKLSRGYMAGVHFVCAHVDLQRATEFVTTMTNGTNIHSKNHPAAMLRAKYLKHATSNEVIDELTAIEQAAFYVKAFNAYRDNKTIGQLKLMQGGDRPENFPRVGG